MWLKKQEDPQPGRAWIGAAAAIGLAAWLALAPAAARSPAGRAAPAGATATGFANCPQFFAGGRAPAVALAGRLRELCYDGFAILHSGESRTPVYVAQRLNRDIVLRARRIERQGRFFADARLRRGERAELEDYRGSGWSRGHMAPAADMPTERAMAQSFSLANMVPQDPRQNGGPWARIEEDTRRYALRARGDVYVLTGPVFADRQVIGPNRVHVPTHLFKLVHDAVTGRTWVHWQPNRPDAKVNPPLSYAGFQRWLGLDLLPGVEEMH
ncbi:DNA/RNA non-specific endonuclease [Xenophilus sp. Marseille-Q4582]|uniref:DNA/RNA non-specific endonuclease n=1 Tax=Xenophilus sp. Marseille-Q4582 TaxID=2866600 RepID=UPI001CE424F9|nr:DNA/RNA non-specific endonuclease [Xenophilus sp. Marseille-Q4582]